MFVILQYFNFKIIRASKYTIQKLPVSAESFRYRASSYRLLLSHAEENWTIRATWSIQTEEGRNKKYEVMVSWSLDSNLTGAIRFRCLLSVPSEIMKKKTVCNRLKN
jgi:hypothetical protein